MKSKKISVCILLTLFSLIYNPSLSARIKKHQIAKAKADAKHDAGKGLYKIFVIGPKRFGGKFANFLTQYMQKKYKIQLIITGCEITQYTISYSEAMQIIIKQKFGPNFFKKMLRKAKTAFKKQNKQ